MTKLKKVMFAALAAVTMSTAGVSFTPTPANANHYGVYHGGGQVQRPAYNSCHWGWVRWQDSYGNWHKKWKNHCNHKH